jgi:hypothetical protein
MRFLRKVYGQETLCGVKVVFSALINDPKIIILGRSLVRQNLVDFVKFKRYRISRIVDTDPRARLKTFR